MKLRPVILLLLMVLLPAGVLTEAARRLAERESQLVQQRFRQLMEGRLADTDQVIAAHFERLATDCRRITAIDDYGVDGLRETIRREPAVLQLFVLNPQGQLQYPNPAESLNNSEQGFLLRAASMFSGQDIQNAVALANEQTEGGAAESNPAPPGSAQRVVPEKPRVVPEKASQRKAAELLQAAESSGWFVWYWERGLNLIFWQRRPSGHVVGAALERARWMSDLLAELPETPSPGNSSDGSAAADGNATVSERSGFATRMRLINAGQETVYQWGTYEVPDVCLPLCEVSVSAPLSSWRLQCFVPDEQLQVGTGQSAWLGLAGGLLAVSIAVAACAVVLFRDYSRDMRDARQQVSFVNQVSHELKTPLTNIRLYAELLERDLDGFADDETVRPRQRLSVILQEGQRLGRLVGNVLTFARQQRRNLQPQPGDVVVDNVLRQIVERFRPALDELSIELTLQFDAAGSVKLDADFLEQIVGNLISNVEKYAAAGGVLSISSCIADGQTVIEVADRGPGIAVADRDRVFRPFSRGSNDIRSVAGTGIGLSIARELARLHGGDLILIDNQPGCRFRVTLRSL